MREIHGRTQHPKSSKEHLGKSIRRLKRRNVSSHVMNICRPKRRNVFISCDEYMSSQETKFFHLMWRIYVVSRDETLSSQVANICRLVSHWLPSSHTRTHTHTPGFGGATLTPTRMILTVITLLEALDFIPTNLRH